MSTASIGGAFELSRYASSSTGLIHPIRVRQGTLDADFDGSDNDPPAASANTPVRVSAYGSPRQNGIVARNISISFTGSPPSPLVGKLQTIPVMTQEVWDSVTDGDPVTYLGAAAKVVGKRGERPEGGPGAPSGT